MSPTRRDILKLSAGTVAAALAGLPTDASTMDEAIIEPPKVVAVCTAMVALKMNDGSIKTVTFLDEDPDRREAYGTFSDYHPDNQPYSEKIDPELARSSATWLGSVAMVMLEMMHREGIVVAW